MLSDIAGLCTLAFIIVGFIVGVRLVLLSRKTRGLPEFVFGTGLAIIVGIGYPLTLAGRASVHTAPEAARWMIALSTIPMTLGWTAVWIFTWRVFRPDYVVARRVSFGAIGLTVCFGIASIARTLTVADPATLDFGELAFVGTSLMAAASYVWGGVESFRYYGMMQKRLALGLADPVITNRFLLWGLVMAFSCVSTSVPTFASMAGVNTLTSPAVMSAAAASGLACAASLWLSFFPPQTFLRRLQVAS